MACEVPGDASRGSEEGSAAPGGFPVAEAKVQATTSVTLHGMAGFKGCRPVPPTPVWRKQQSRGHSDGAF